MLPDTAELEWVVLQGCLVTVHIPIDRMRWLLIRPGRSLDNVFVTLSNKLSTYTTGKVAESACASDQRK